MLCLLSTRRLLATTAFINPKYDLEYIEQVAHLCNEAAISPTYWNRPPHTSRERISGESLASVKFVINFLFSSYIAYLLIKQANVESNCLVHMLTHDKIHHTSGLYFV